MFDCYVLYMLFIICVAFVGFDAVGAAEDDFTRKVTLSHNPGCDLPECEASENLIYARSEGSNDSLHYILSTVGSCSPTLLLLRSEDSDAELKVNWTKFIRSPIHEILDAVRLISNSSGGESIAVVKSVVVFDQVVEYNDSDDTAALPKNESARFTPIMLKQLKWVAVNTTDELTSCITGTTDHYPHSFTGNSSISLNFSPFGSAGRSTKLPALPHSADSSDWEFNLNSLLSRGGGSRFGIELLILGFGSNISKLRSKTINDEYAPSVFTTEKLEWTGLDKMDGPRIVAFHQWRAVSYTSKSHERKMASDVKMMDFSDFNTTSSGFMELASNRLLLAYFGSNKLETLTMRSATINFGKSQDGFYAATNYTSWTSTIGFGTPPVDEFSTLVICMLVAGIGCPLAVIIAGGIYVTWVRMKRSKGGIERQLVTNYDYQPIET